MSNVKNVLKNGIFSIIYQLITVILSLVTRTCFLRFVGVELLGINSTFTSVLSTLSLAELGFETAITFHLYNPIENEDYESINKIINIYKKVYHGIAIVIIISSIALMPFLHIFLKGVSITSYIYFIFFVQALNTAFSYFLSYKRTLLFADKKDYVCKSVDILSNLIFSLLKIGALVLYKRYEIYLFVTIFQTVTSNLVIHKVCKRMYPFLTNDQIDKGLLNKIFGSVKNVFAAKISNYVYSSTDNIIISSMIGSNVVGLVVNYTTIILQLKVLMTLVMNPVIPIIGRSLVASRDNKMKSIEQFYLISFIRYCMILFLVVPTYILLEDFIVIWIGGEYLLSKIILSLLIADLYISVIYAPCFDYLNAAGLFKYEKNVMIVAAIMNIVSSVLLTFFIGLPGVFFGTIITQVFLWVSRSVILFKQYFENNKMLRRYWLKQIYYFFIFVITVLICIITHQMIHVDNLIVSFIINGLICEIFILFIMLVTLSKSKEFKCMVSLLKQLMHRN